MDWDLVIIFGFVLALAALRGHYRRLDKAAASLPAADQAALNSAMDVARRLEQRMDTLERLLDEDAPGWRARVRA